MRARLHALALAFPLLLAQRSPLATPRGGPLTLPAGAVAELLERLDPATPKAPVGPPWPAWSDRSASGWGGELSWRRWVELVRAEAAAEKPDPARRAQLAVLARLQGRDGDAWAHFLACGADPARLATLLPFFVPGVPQEWLGKDGPLSDGILLAPALPPCDEPSAGLRWLAGRTWKLAELAVGSARFSLEVSVERDGLAVNLDALRGGPARVSVRPPLPRGIEPGLLFADWEKRPGETGPVEFTLQAPADAEQKADEHSLWITFRPPHPPDELWPSPRPADLARPLPPRRLLISSPRGDEPHLARLAEALAELFEVETRLVPEDFRAEPGLEPLVLHLGAGPSGERKLAEMLGLSEAFLLRRTGR